jgi:hypothetical protein
MPGSRERLDSRPPNAGDRDHLVYVDRRLLDLLLPAYATVDRTDPDAVTSVLLRTLDASTRAQLTLLDRVGFEPPLLPKARRQAASKKRQPQSPRHGFAAS